MNEPTTLVPIPERAPFVFEGAGLTHVGRVRASNEDAILTDPSGVLWAVADGMGGHGHGDLAADIVLDHLLRMPEAGDPATLMADLLASASREIVKTASEIGVDTMGATVVAMMLDGAFAYISWAGDCRAYLCRQNAIRMLTRDHSFVQHLVDEGMLSAENADGHAAANVVTRAVGADEVLDVDHIRVPLMAGDGLVLCSDGLTACLDDSSICDLVRAAPDAETAVRSLVRATLERGAPDNVSAIVVSVGSA